MTRNYTKQARSVVAASIGLTLMGPGFSGVATAAQVAGHDEVPALEQSVGTDALNIRLTKGNPDSDGPSVAGSVEGVTIHLHRLRGIDSKNAADMQRVRNASLADIHGWDTDLHLTQVTGLDGGVKFANLAEGIYLVTSTAPEGNYREINPFLVAVPFHSLSNNPAPVPGVIVAKTHILGQIPPPSTPGSTPSSENPRETPSREPTPSNEPPSPVVRDPEPPTEEPPVGEPPRVPTALAMTGAQVIGMVAVAALLIIAGLSIILRTRFTNKESGKN